LHPVRIARGLDDGNFVEILSGQLKPGDEVVVDEQKASHGARSAAMMGAPRMPHL
jgi:hypothetical protein